jgi:hypothetical protein
MADSVCVRERAAYPARMRFHAFRVFLLLGLGAQATTPDGPYVLRTTGETWEAVSVVAQGESAQRQARPVTTGTTLTIPAVGTAPAFDVRLRAPDAKAANAEVKTAAKAPVFVVADTHGEFEILVTLLRAHKVVGTKLEWTYGKGHLVVLGDVFDRGPNQLEILWLLYKLQHEAEQAGGGAHLVLGNHEAMVMRGDLRYLHARYADTTRVLGVPDYSHLFSRDSLLGQWLRTRPAVLTVNDLLCLHAGVSRALLDSTLSQSDINAAVREVLSGGATGATAELVMGSLGPLWYRGYFPEQPNFPAATLEDVDLTLRTFNVRRILIGHTIVPTVTPLFGGKVIAVQVYPRREDGGRTQFEGLVIRDGDPWQALPDGKQVKLANRK